MKTSSCPDTLTNVLKLYFVVEIETLNSFAKVLIQVMLTDVGFRVSSDKLAIPKIRLKS